MSLGHAGRFDSCLGPSVNTNTRKGTMNFMTQIDPVWLLALPAFVIHGRVKARRLQEARAAAMRRHPSARN